ncbi:unnamed protein product [Gadus morhua 'NCC']
MRVRATREGHPAAVIIGSPQAGAPPGPPLPPSPWLLSPSARPRARHRTAQRARQPTLKQQRPISDSIRGGQGPSSLEDRLYYWTTSIPIPMETTPRGSETNSLSLLAHVARS